MEENKQDSSSEQPKKRRKPRRPKRYVIGSGLFLLLILLIHFTVYFSSDALLRTYIQEKVEQESQGAYSVDFDRFYLSLLQRGFFVENLQLIPTEDLSSYPEKKLFEAKIPLLEVLKIGYSFRQKSISIGELKIHEPSLAAVSDPTLEPSGQSKMTNPVELLKEESQKSLSKYVSGFEIENLYLYGAQSVLNDLFEDYGVNADHLDVQLKDLDLFQSEEKEPFWSKGFSLAFKNFQLPLADSIHLFTAKELQISSIRDVIRGSGFTLSPVKSTPDSTTKILYTAAMDTVNIKGADINRAFLQKEVFVDEIRLGNPTIQVATDQTNEAQSKDIALARDLYRLIDGALKEINIGFLQIQNGSFEQKGIRDPLSRRIQIDNVQLVLVDFLLNDQSYQTTDRIFYSNQADIRFNGYRMSLADKQHWLASELVVISTKDDRVKAEQLSVYVDEELQRTGQLSNPEIYDIKLAELVLDNVNLRKVYNEQNLEMERLNIQQPIVHLSDLQKSGEVKIEKDFSLYDFTNEYLKSIKIEELSLEDGSLILDLNTDGTAQDSVSLGKLSFVLNNFSIDSSQLARENRVFYAENLRFELEDYSMKLADNFHQLKAKRISLDTKTEELLIRDFYFLPADQSKINERMERFDKSSYLEIYVPEFRLFGADIPRAYFDKDLQIKTLLVSDPEVTIYTFDREQRQTKDKIQRRDLYDIVSPYFDRVSIENLKLLAGNLNFNSTVNDSIRTFTENDISISLKSFRLDSTTWFDDRRTLFSDEVELEMNRYVFNLANEKYAISVDKISFNSEAQAIIASNVRLKPNPNITSKLQVETLIPEMQLSGVDIDKFLFNNELKLEKIRLGKPRITLNIDDDIADNKQTKRDRKTELPKNINSIQVDTLLTNDGLLEIFFLSGKKRNRLINSDVELLINNFRVDSTTLENKTISGLFGNIDAQFENFNLKLADSVHTVLFDRLYTSNSGQDIQIKNLTVKPRQSAIDQGTQNLYAVSAPELIFSGTNINDIEQTKLLKLKRIQLISPQITYYVNESAQIGDSPAPSFEKILNESLASIGIEEIDLERGAIKIISKDPVNAQSFVMQDLNGNWQDLFIDLKSSFENDPLFFSKAFEVTIPSYEIKTADSLYYLKSGPIKISPNSLEINRLQLIPRLGKFAFGRKVGEQTDRMQFETRYILLDGLDVKTLFKSGEISAQTALIDSLALYTFRDKRNILPEDRKVLMPQQLLKLIESPLKIDSISLTRGYIQYEEFGSKSLIPGRLFFSDLNAAISQVDISRDEPILVKASANLMGTSTMEVSILLQQVFPYAMDVTGNMGTFDLQQINSILEPIIFVSVKKGTIDQLDFNFTANLDSAHGEMTLLYHDLKIALIEPQDMRPGGFTKKLQAAIANAFIVKKKNPRFWKGTVTGPIHTKRDERKFIFNYWWKSLLSGIRETIGLKEKESK